MVTNSLSFGVLAVALSLIINQKVGSYVGGVIWAKINTICTPVLVKIHGKTNIQKKQSYVIVANHLSTFDIFALYSWSGIDFKWVMKKEIRKYPGVGFGSEAVGHIFVDRSSTAKAIASINEAKRKIINGTSVIFFAEGTHSKNSALLPFKKGAFKMAFDLQLPMLPITINSTDRVWPTGIFNIFPGKVEIFVHPAIDIYDSQEIQIPELMRRTRDTLLQRERNSTAIF